MSRNISLVKSFWQLFNEQKWDQAQDLLHSEFVAAGLRPITLVDKCAIQTLRSSAQVGVA